MSWTSHENWEPGVEHKKNAETMEREQHPQGGQHIIRGVRPKQSYQLTWRG